MTFLHLGAVVFFALLDRHYLRRTALAGNQVLRTNARRPRRAARAMHHLLHAVGDLGPVGRVTQHDVGHRVRVNGRYAFNGLGQVRTDPFALAGNQRSRLRQLQRRGLHVALTNPQNQGFARKPGLPPRRPLPLAGRHQTGGLFEHVERDFLADTKLIHVRRQTINPQLVGEVIKVGVVGTHDRRVQVHIAITAAVPVTVLVIVIGQHVVARVVDP